MQTPLLHLVIPAYNPGCALDQFLAELLPALLTLPFVWRVQLVDDGSSLRERERIQNMVSAYRPKFAGLCRPIVLAQNSGKGAAIRAGWAAAGSAEWLAFVDADGSVPADEVVRHCQSAIAHRPQPVCQIASRRPDVGHHQATRWHRQVMGRVFAKLVQQGLRLPLYDTQCGLKILPGTVYEWIRTEMIESRFSFDLELLCLLRHAGVTIIETSIDWNDLGESTVRFSRDIPAMAWSIWTLRRRMKGWERGRRKTSIH